MPTHLFNQAKGNSGLDMDNKTLITLSKLTVEARKVIGAIYPAKMLKDPSYCAEIFQKIDDAGDVELVLLSLDLREQLGLLKNDKLVAKETPETKEEKYVYSVRG